MSLSASSRKFSEKSLCEIFLGFCVHDDRCFEPFRAIIFRKIRKFKPEHLTEEGTWTEDRLEKYFELLLLKKLELEFSTSAGKIRIYTDKPNGRGFLSYVKIAQPPDRTLHAYFKNMVKNIVLSNTPEGHRKFYNAIVVGMRRDKQKRFDRFGPLRDFLGLSAWAGKIDSCCMKSRTELLQMWGLMWHRNNFPRRIGREIFCPERLIILKAMFDEINEWVKAADFYKAVETLFPYDLTNPNRFGKPQTDADEKKHIYTDDEPTSIEKIKQLQDTISKNADDWEELLNKYFAKFKHRHYLLLYFLQTGDKSKSEAAKAVGRSPAFTTRTEALFKAKLTRLAEKDELTEIERAALHEYVKFWLKKGAKID